MFYKAVSVALVAVLLHGSVAAQDQTQSPPQTIAKMQQVLHKAQEKGKAVKVTLNKKIDKQRKFGGKVGEISDTGFTLIDHETGKHTKLAYEDVQQIKQKGVSKVLIVVIVVVALAFVWTIFLERD